MERPADRLFKGYVQPNILLLSTRIPSSLLVSTPTGQAVTHRPHTVQVTLSMTGLPGASPRLEITPMAHSSKFQTWNALPAQRRKGRKEIQPEKPVQPRMHTDERG
jgi:hypothetical protein